MEYKNQFFCDYCFAPIRPGCPCERCGLTKENYKPAKNLLKPSEVLLGKYIIGRVLGRGGFGTTYMAYSIDRGSVVALKEYFPSGISYRGENEKSINVISADKEKIFEKGAKRFFEEAKTVSMFNSNSNIAAVYEFFYENNTAYYSMEYLEGIDLKGYVSKKGGKIPENEAVVIIKEIANALITIHSTGTLHRDISPDNIFICTDGKVKLIDFGAAKQFVGEQSNDMSIILKQGFAPIEQYQSKGKQGMWTDIYALGATIYYALTGKIPEDAMSRHEHPDIESASVIGISDAFWEIINKCMKVRASERYQNAYALQQDLMQLGNMNANVGGEEYVQPICRDPRTMIIPNSGSTSFIPVEPVKPYTGYNPLHYTAPVPQTNNVSRYYPNSEQYEPVEKKGSGNIAKGIAIGAGIFVAVAIAVIVIVKLLAPGGMGNQPVPMQPQMQQQQGMPNGGNQPVGGNQPGQPMQ